MTEFALIAPVFLLLIVGLLVFGRLFFYWMESNHLASETARWAAIDHNPYEPQGQTLQEHAKESATKEFSDKAVVCIEFPDVPPPTGTNPPDPPEVGQRVRVRVELPVTFTEFFGFGVTLRGTSTMRIEQMGDVTGPETYSAGCLP
jgi:TadE-like protein